MIIVEFGFGIKKMIKKRKYDQEWKEYDEQKFVLVETIIDEIGKNKTEKKKDKLRYQLNNYPLEEL